ncbi:hypothetical protein FBU30_001066, partial [Linnemannia zychae]
MSKDGIHNRTPSHKQLYSICRWCGARSLLDRWKEKLVGQNSMQLVHLAALATLSSEWEKRDPPWADG